MKRKLSIGFFTATLAAFIILAAAYHFTYERAVERAREEVALAGQEEEEEEPPAHPFVEHSGYLAERNEFKVTKVPVNLE